MVPTRHVSATPATQALRQAGVPLVEHVYDYVEHGGTREAATQLGVAENRIVKTLLMQVTAFTVAHSITLGLSIYGLVALPSRLVEPLIAFGHHGLHDSDHRVDDLVERRPGALQGDLPLRDACRVQQVLDHSRELLDLTLDDRARPLPQLPAGSGLHQPQRGVDGPERLPQFVRHCRDERVLLTLRELQRRHQSCAFGDVR